MKQAESVRVMNVLKRSVLSGNSATKNAIKILHKSNWWMMDVSRTPHARHVIK